jgi:hypothetical protein
MCHSWWWGEVLTGRPRHVLEDNINMDLREVGMDGATLIRLRQDRVQWRAFVNTIKLRSCEVCSGWVTYCHRCLTCFKVLCVYAPR